MLEWVAIASAGLNILSDIQQGKAEEEAAKYNAGMLRKQAFYRKQKAEMDAKQIKSEGVSQLANMRVNYAASGVAMEGSALDVLADSARKIKRDELTARYQGMVDASVMEAEASQQLRAGEAARSSSYFNALGSGLRGYANYNRAMQLT